MRPVWKESANTRLIGPQAATRGGAFLYSPEKELPGQYIPFLYAPEPADQPGDGVLVPLASAPRAGSAAGGVGTGVASSGLRAGTGVASSGLGAGAGVASSGLRAGTGVASAGLGAGTGVASAGLGAGTGVASSALGRTSSAAKKLDGYVHSNEDDEHVHETEWSSSFFLWPRFFYKVENNWYGPFSNEQCRHWFRQNYFEAEMMFRVNSEEKRLHKLFPDGDYFNLDLPPASVGPLGDDALRVAEEHEAEKVRKQMSHERAAQQEALQMLKDESHLEVEATQKLLEQEKNDMIKARKSMELATKNSLETKEKLLKSQAEQSRQVEELKNKLVITEKKTQAVASGNSSPNP